jgi:NADH dehydrogenase/NADH:ubiquinone oxidoreductase subunit G
MKAEVTVIIDGKTIKASPDETILEVARRSEISIPTLCYL